MAADELEAWELSAMRDPRNWVRPAAALVAGGAAGAALVVLRARRRTAARQRPPQHRPGLDRAAAARAKDLAARETRGGCAGERARATCRLAPAPARLSLAHGHLLSPSLARDGGLVLELRSPDLPRLHDDHPVGMRCPECARQRTVVKRLRSTGRRPARDHALIAINVIVFLTEGQFTFTGTRRQIYEKARVRAEGILSLGVAHDQ